MAGKTSFSKLLERYPASAFNVSASVCMLTLAIGKFSDVFNWPGFLSDVFFIVASIVTAVILLLYALKYFKYPDLAAEEFDDPRGLCFFSFMTVSLLLLSIIYNGFTPVSAVLLVLGGVIQTVFIFYTAAYWLEKPDLAYESGGEKYIPIAGVLLIPIAGTGLADKGYFPVDILYFYLAAGFVLWFMILAFLTAGFYSGKFKNEDIASFTAVSAAAPAIACLSAAYLTGSFLPATLFWWISLFFLILTLVILRNFRKRKFTVSFWNYVFPALAFSYSGIDGFGYGGFNFWVSAAFFVLAAIWTFFAAAIPVKTFFCEVFR